MPENDRGGSARTPLEMLRGVTRHVATAESLEVVLQSIVAALVEQADAANARIFLALTDDECPVCRSESAGRRAAGVRAGPPLRRERRAHRREEHLPHRVSFDSPLPPAIHGACAIPSCSTTGISSSSSGSTRARCRPGARWGSRARPDIRSNFRGEQLGSIGFLARRRITTEEFALLGIFADQAALAIRNAQLYREVERYRDRLELENAYLQEAIAEERGFEGIVGESPALRAVLRKVQQVAPVETTVLLTGETGTGKELSRGRCTRGARGATGRSSRSTAGRSRRAWSRASCSGTRRARSPAPCSAGSGASSWPTRARCSWTRWASCRSTPR